MRGSTITNASRALSGGTWSLGDSTVTRFGYGAMQLAGPGVFGPPADHSGAVEVLRAAVDAGITHIDTTRPGPIAEAFETLVELQQQGLIRHLGVSNVTADQVAEARATAPIACVQNMYNLAQRHDDDLVDDLAAADVAYVPFFPLGGFSPLQSQELSAVAARLEATPVVVALVWLLQRSPNIDRIAR